MATDSRSPGWTSSVTRWLPLLLLAALQPLLWKLRIHDAASPNPQGVLPFGVIDHYIEHQPMVSLFARRLAAGELPLWDPHELFGVPLFAGLQLGMLYPPNLIFLLFDAPLASELVLIAHLGFAALCTYGLARSWEVPRLAALAAGLSFAWGGRINTILNQHSPLMALTWMPLTVWLVERSLCRKPRAIVGLALAVCLQVLVASFEAVVFNLEAAGLYALFRLAPRLFRGERAQPLRDGLALLAAVLLGLALAAPLLAPAVEFVARSSRLDVSIDEARAVGSIPLAELAQMLLTNAHLPAGHPWVHVHAGVLALLGIALGAGMRGLRPLYLYAITLCAFGALLTGGGALFELYASTPMGGNLRRPWKFLVFLDFGMALLAAIGVTRLVGWSRRGSRPAWTNPTWAASLALCLVLGAFAARDAVVAPYAVAAVGLLTLAAAPMPAARRAAVLALVALHVGQVFFAFENAYARAIRQPEVFHSEDALWRQLAERAGDQRILISGRLWIDPAFMQKQAELQGFYATGGYNALASREHARFFEAAGLEPALGQRFFGASGLGARVDWSLVDRTSTRFVVMRGDEKLAKLLERPDERRRLGFRRVALDVPTRALVYERDSALPRARFTADYVLARDADAALAALAALAPGTQRVVIEATQAEIGREANADARGSVEVRTLDPERVVLDVEADAPGLVVLSDSWYPGWQARVDGAVVPILRADTLLRAVAVPAGRSRVEFDFRQPGARLGAAIAAVAAVLLALLYRSSRQRKKT